MRQSFSFPKASLALFFLYALEAQAIEWQTGSNNVQWGYNCDWVGGDLRHVSSSGSQCGGICEADQACSHFTWTNYDHGTCWLKGNGVSPTAVDKNTESAVCGWVNRGGPDPSPVATGRTTRYWDCCKPSCAWSGKAAVSRPVNTCAKNGLDVLTNSDAQSGCGGGPAFSCNNNQPWVGADNVAYGFAAANFAGQTERDWCCACYEFIFNSAPIVGKKMIVQVTNTGGDVGHNQFDLQIPGGGVGIFNGCSSQWGAPNDGWGQRYGGVGSEAECNQLPQVLQSGCKWRFQWLQGADNPTMTFRPVPCPAELTGRSGCRRS